MRRLLAATLIATALVGSAGAADVHVGVTIGIPAPPTIVLPGPPHLVVVPGIPTVQYAPDVGANFFFYGGSYYTYHSGGWFIAPSYGGPWAYVERVRVPHSILVVPHRYYRFPPRYVRNDHGYRRGHPHGMPPGQAKKLYRSYFHEHGHREHGRRGHDGKH